HSRTPPPVATRIPPLPSDPVARGRPARTLFPYATLFRSSPYEYTSDDDAVRTEFAPAEPSGRWPSGTAEQSQELTWSSGERASRSEEHTSELQSREKLVCRLLLENKKAEEHTSETHHQQQ